MMIGTSDPHPPSSGRKRASREHIGQARDTVRPRALQEALWRVGISQNMLEKTRAAKRLESLLDDAKKAVDLMSSIWRTPGTRAAPAPPPKSPLSRAGLRITPAHPILHICGSRISSVIPSIQIDGESPLAARSICTKV